VGLGLGVTERGNSSGYHILVIEDERKLAEAIASSLAESGNSVTIAYSGEDGYFHATTTAVDAVILDLNLPGRDGMEVLRNLRATGHDVPLLVLTARDALEDRVRGLDLGADDYLTKPFAFPELHARLRAILRRGRGPEEPLILRCGDLELDRLTRRVSNNGLPIELTAKEFEILECLLRNHGRVVARDTLAREIWGERARAVMLDNVIDVHMARLRSKIDSTQSRARIRTVRGVGFSVAER